MPAACGPRSAAPRCRRPGAEGLAGTPRWLEKSSVLPMHPEARLGAACCAPRARSCHAAPSDRTGREVQFTHVPFPVRISREWQSPSNRCSMWRTASRPPSTGTSGEQTGGALSSGSSQARAACGSEYWKAGVSWFTEFGVQQLRPFAPAVLRQGQPFAGARRDQLRRW